jgi:hypothetical protein
MGDGPLRHLGAKVLVGEKPPADREPSMNEITTVCLLADNVCTGQKRTSRSPGTSPGWTPEPT